ncbi:unnamed protein product [Mucor hiemalis]
MKATTVNTIAYVVPIDKTDVSNTQQAYIFDKKTLDDKEELSATIDNEQLHWKFDCIVDDASLLKDECCNLIDSVLEGYNAAYFSLSVSDGHRHAMDEKRNQTFKVLFEQLDTAISNSAEIFELEYAFLGLVNSECYDVRKKIIRTNESMETRGIDSIMRSVDNVGKIRDLMIDREMTIPYLLSIKLTNTNTKTIGRFSIIDLLYSPFSPSVRDNTLNSIQDILSALTTPKYTGLMQLGSSFLAKEITKYICGHNELLMILFMNDQIIKESHSRDTLFLLSLVSSFTSMPVRTFPNVIISNNAELKKLRSEIKKLSKQREKLEKLHESLVSQLHERCSTIDRLEEMELEFQKKLPQVRDAHEDESIEVDKMLILKRKQIQYLETTLLSKSLVHAFDLQQYKIEIAKLNTMLDIKDFSEEDISENAKRMEALYEEPILQLERRQRALTEAINELQAEEAKLIEQIKAAEEVYPEAEDSVSPVKVEEPEEPEPEEMVETVAEAEDESLISEIQELEENISNINEKIIEIGRSEFREQDNYRAELNKLKAPIEEYEKVRKTKRATVKAQANEKITALAKKLEEVYVEQSEHIQNLKQALRIERGEMSDEDDFQDQEESVPLKRRKVDAESEEDYEE